MRQASASCYRRAPMTRKPKDGWSDLVDGLEEDPTKPRSIPPKDGAPQQKAPRTSAPPASSAGSLRLPKPQTSGAASQKNPAPAPLSSFSGKDLVEKLAAETKPVVQASTWDEYRELIVTAIVGAIAIAGVITYQM